MGVLNKNNRQNSANDRPKSKKAKFLTKILLDLLLSRNCVVSSILTPETNKSLLILYISISKIVYFTERS